MSLDGIINLLHKSIKKKNYDLVPTLKNRNSRRKYGLTLFEIEEFLLRVTKKDLYKGPVEDRDVLGEEVYIFKKEIKENVTFYIKIKKDTSVNYDRIKILSIHEDEI